MAYTINKSNGTVVATVQDGTINTTTSLSLIGRNYQGYGETVNENLVRLLENSASSSSPASPITGELWYDTASSTLKIFDGSDFAQINTVRASTTQPTASLQEGVFWYNTSTNNLSIYNGSSFDSLGPITILDEDDFASDSATGVPSQQSTKAYIQSVVIDSNSLPIRDQSSNQITASFTDGILIRGTGGISTSVDTDNNGEDRLTIALANTLDVNALSSADSAFVTVNDGLLVTGNFTFDGGVSVSSILDEDTMSSNSATALATQQSIKSYVDTELANISQTSIGENGTTVTATDSGSGSIVMAVDSSTTATFSSSTATFNTSITVDSDSGLVVGADSDITMTQSGNDFTVNNVNVDGNIIFSGNTGSSIVTMLTLDPGVVTVGKDLSVQGNLTVAGTTTTANAVTSTIEDPLIVLNRGLSVANLYDVGIIYERGSQINGAMFFDESADEFVFAYTNDDGSTAGNIVIDSYADVQANEFRGTATEAQYADLAERYETDLPMEVGDVVKLGGDKEITKTTQVSDTDVFGVIAENPAFKMNSGAGTDQTHPFVTLTGRTMCKIKGSIAKGDRLCSSDLPGVAQKLDINSPNFNILSIIGRSLEDNSSDDVRLVEVVLGKN
jgi:hypothetical protein